MRKKWLFVSVADLIFLSANYLSFTELFIAEKLSKYTDP